MNRKTAKKLERSLAGNKGFKKILNYDQVKEMSYNGKSQTEIAKILGVTQGAISQVLSKIKGGVARDVALVKGHEITQRNIDAAKELNRINRVINNLIDELTNEPIVLKKLADGVQAILEDRGSKEDKQRVRETLGIILKDRDLQIRASQEIRGQLSLQLEMFREMVDMRVVLEFQQTVLNIIGKQSQKVRGKIISALKAEKALRESVKLF